MSSRTSAAVSSIHYHLVLAADTPERQQANRSFIAVLKGTAAAIATFGARPGTLERKTVGPGGLAAEFGFGFVSLEAACHGSARVAGYFCKYGAKNRESGQPEITETVHRSKLDADAWCTSLRS
jgi:hypothetical protein